MRVNLAVLPVTLASLLLAPSIGWAQACVGGRVATDLTLYNCCWPGQVWSDERRACSAPPICPDGMERHADDCVTPPVMAQVRFVAPAALHEAFTVIDERDRVVDVCASAPCVLRMPPGTYQVVLDARWHHARRRLVVPMMGTTFRNLTPPPRQGIGALAAAGFVTTGLGAVMVGTGLGVVLGENGTLFNTSGVSGSSHYVVRPHDDTPWIVLGVTGGLATVTGFAMLMAWTERLRAHAASAERVTLTVAPTPGGGMAAVAVQWRGL